MRSAFWCPDKDLGDEKSSMGPFWVLIVAHTYGQRRYCLQRSRKKNPFKVFHEVIFHVFSVQGTPAMLKIT